MKQNKLATLTLFFVVCVTFILYTFHSTSQQYREVSSHLYNASVKTILIWNDFFEYKHMGQGVGHRIFHDNNCPVRNCYIWDIADGTPPLPVEEFDLVWFHGMDVPQGTLLRNKPPRRKSHQRYLFYLLEAPSTFKFDLKPLDGFFNWTASYRRDSDIFHPYGVVLRKDYEVMDHPMKWMEPTYSDVIKVDNKTRLVAWIVSNCVKVPSNRDAYVAELRKYIYVDIFGDCGKQCDQSCSDEGMNATYKFYLAFENAACVDYVTEKFFRTLKMNVVPVVYGGADYKSIAPPMSYVDANDYESPEELATYLKYLDENPKEYAKYFWWKKYYTVGNSANILCQVCEMLHKYEDTVKVKSDLDFWWNGPEVCYSPVEVGISTWIGRTVNYPQQIIKYTTVRLLSTGNYAVILFILILTLIIIYCIAMYAIKVATNMIRSGDKIAFKKRYWKVDRFKIPAGDSR